MGNNLIHNYLNNMNDVQSQSMAKKNERSYFGVPSVSSTIESFDALSGAFSFEAQSACIAVKGNSLFVGRDGKISKLDIIHR